MNQATTIGVQAERQLLLNGNKIGHTLDQAEIKVKMDEVRAAYLATLSDQQRPHSEKLDDIRIAAAALQHCGPYMVAATETARAGKKP